MPRTIPHITDKIRDSFEQCIEFEPNSGCWLWTGGCNGNGYGFMYINRVGLRVHRLAYTMYKGPIPTGLVIDHLCRMPRCVNPAHLEVVTQRINTLRGIAPAAQQAKRIQCPQGHRYSPENTYVDPMNHRHCKTCGRRRHLEWYYRRVSNS